jgi:hypothetical protein
MRKTIASTSGRTLQSKAFKMIENEIIRSILQVMPKANPVLESATITSKSTNAIYTCSSTPTLTSENRIIQLIERNTMKYPFNYFFSIGSENSKIYLYIEAEEKL